jgi:hypothetical protein
MVGCELSCGCLYACQRWIARASTCGALTLVRVAFRTTFHIPYTGRAMEVLRDEMIVCLVGEVNAAWWKCGETDQRRRPD